MESSDSLESRWSLVTLLSDLCKSEQWRANTRFRVHTRLDSSFHCSFVRLFNNNTDNRNSKGQLWCVEEEDSTGRVQQQIISSTKYISTSTLTPLSAPHTWHTRARAPHTYTRTHTITFTWGEGGGGQQQKEGGTRFETFLKETCF